MPEIELTKEDAELVAIFENTGGFGDPDDDKAIARLRSRLRTLAAVEQALTDAKVPTVYDGETVTTDERVKFLVIERDAAFDARKEWHAERERFEADRDRLTAENARLREALNKFGFVESNGTFTLRSGGNCSIALLSMESEFENAPSMPGPCVHCGKGIAEHKQSGTDPTKFICPSAALAGAGEGAKQ